MPWKGETDPYKVWLSEVILQQTRVEQGWAYYEKFINHYPAVSLLAAAKDEDVFKLWKGLGYYSRCRNLLFTARFITKELKGNFPDTYKDILQLKGVGPYTAAAIASFCFNLPHAVVDGNVIRVLARVYGIQKSAASNEGKKYFERKAFENLSQKKPGLYNQAIMDFGATVCKPQLPLCSKCVMQKICVAYREDKVDAYPVKEKALIKRQRWFNYFILQVKEKTFVRPRTEKDIWQGLYEYALYESATEITWNKKNILQYLEKEMGVSGAESVSICEAKPQQLTHQFIRGCFIKVKLISMPSSLRNGEWLTQAELAKKAFPKFINGNAVG